MKGINLAEQRMYSVNSYEQSTNTTPCIFLSHRSTDKDRVVKIGEYIKKAGLNIYLDLNDAILQGASTAKNAETVTACIQKGISLSSYMLCILSDNTFDKNSWWVSYEIGYADRGKIGCSIMPLANVGNIPEFLEIKEVIRKIEEMNTLLLSLSKTKPQIIYEHRSYELSQSVAIQKSSINHDLYNVLKY